jgi:putative transposase
MKFDFMQEQASLFPVKKMACVFNVSRAGYYRHIGKKESRQSAANRDLVANIKSVYKENKEIYGSPRIHAVLKKTGKKCSRKLVAKLMRDNGIRAKTRKNWRPSNKACKDMSKIAPNHINQNFAAPAPNKVWVSDITYIRTYEGWLYVAAIMDLFSRRIVGLATSDRIDTELINRAFGQSCCHRIPQPGLVLHSDRGTQYTSNEYKKTTQNKGVLLSMSAQGYCYDNAAMESFFHTLKTEHVYRCSFQTRKEAALSIFEYIEVFYNRKRLHSTLNYMSPDEFEQQFRESRVKTARPAVEAKIPCV